MSSISWWRLPRGRVWHVAVNGFRSLCDVQLPARGGEWQAPLPPMRARVCSECVAADLRLRDNITQALDRRDVPLPLGDDQIVDAEIFDAEFDTNDVAVIREARMISFGPSTGESPFPFAGISIVNGTVTGSITVDDVDGKLAAQIAAVDQGGTLEAGFDADGDEIVVVDQEGVPYRPVPDGAIADLAQQLRDARNQP